MSGEFTERTVAVITSSGRWRTCLHERAEADHHGCPDCRGTLRRCCLSLVGSYEHRDACPEVVRRRGEDVA